MSSARDRIRPFHLARTGGHVRRALPMARMARLEGLVHEAPGRVEVECRFALDEFGRPMVDLHVRARIVLTCQRCLGPCPLEVDQDVRLGLVRSDAEAAGLEAGIEPLLVEAEDLSLAALIEDELILSLPAFPVHAEGECTAPADHRAAEPAPAPAAESPFAVLGRLRGRGSD